MTEHHQHDEISPAPRTDAPTAPVPVDQPTEQIPTGSRVDDTAQLPRPDRPADASAAPGTDERAVLLRLAQPFEAPSSASGSHENSASARPGPPVDGTDAPHIDERAHPARPEQPVAWVPSSPTGPSAQPTQLRGDGQPPGPATAPTPGWLGGAPHQAVTPTPVALSAPGDGPAPAAATRRTRWTPLVGTATAAALLASFATAGLTGAFEAETTSSSPTASSIATIGQTSTDTVPVAGSSSDDPDWEKVAASVAASVVAIQVATANGGGEGSGVIIDDAGHILTNNHVVSGAASVQVTLNDGRLYEATVVGTDPSTDLAIVQIDDAPDDLSPAALGNSDDVVVGAPVMAVGNPLGLANTVTTGIVSAVDRPVSASSSEALTASEIVVTNAIQIDAAINPGNSGGPLFDAQGRVVGITSSIATLSSGSSQSGSIGLGFAIPVNLARGVAEQLIEDGTAEHAFLGVSLSDGTATADDVSRRGAVVEQVTADSPAAAAELQVGDVIVAIDGKPVGGSEALTAYVRERTAGDTAKLTIVRDGEALDVTVTLATRPTAVAAGNPGSGSSLPDDSSSGGGTEGLLPGFPGSGSGSQDPFGSQG